MPERPPPPRDMGRLLRTSPPEIEVLLRCTCQRLEPGSADRVAAICASPTFSWPTLAAAANHHAIAYFTGRGRRVMLVKGSAIDAVVYAEPWYVRSLDADLLVDQTWPEVDAAARKALAELGFGRWSAADVDFGRHHDLDMNRVLDIDYPRVWKEARTITYQGYQVYVMSPEDMLIAACVNLCRKRFRQLKGNLAVRELILANPALDWDRLVRIAAAAGASRIVWMALEVTADVFGRVAPEHALEALRHGDVRSPLLRALGHGVSVRSLRIPATHEESRASRLLSEILRLSTYRVPQWRREIRARRALWQMKHAGWYVPRTPR